MTDDLTPEEPQPDPTVEPVTVNDESAGEPEAGDADATDPTTVEDDEGQP